MTEKADVVIVGAGVQGASLAFHLANRGIQPLVVERSSVGAGATGRSSGFVRLHYDLEVETRLAWASYPWFRDWTERVGGECGFTRTGFLMLVRPEKYAHLQANVAAYATMGIPIGMLAARDIRLMAPNIAVDDAEIAAYEPESGYADPSAAASAFLGTARARGARLLSGVEVTGINVVGGRIAGVETTKGTISTPVVVDAAGAWAARVASFVGLDIPVSTWRHDVAYLRLPSSMALPFPMVIDYKEEVYFRPEGHEQILVALEDQNELGGSADRDTAHASPGFAERVAERICRRIPDMAAAEFRSSHSGQDGITPDQRAILGRAGPDGFYLDCGHSGTGFKTSPAVGACLSELILDGASSTVDISPFSLDRFAANRPLVSAHDYDAIWR